MVNRNVNQPLGIWLQRDAIEYAQNVMGTQGKCIKLGGEEQLVREGFLEELGWDWVLRDV